MPKLEDVKIEEAQFEAAAADAGEMPEEFGGAKPNLAQGRYIFALPQDLGALWETQESVFGTRLVLQPSDGLAAFSKHERDANGNPAYVGQWYGRISAVPRNRAKKGEPKRLVADMTYLAVALGFPSKAVTVVTKASADRPSEKLTEYVSAGSQKELGQKLESKAGSYFEATNEWSAYCNDSKVRYIGDGTGGNILDPSNTKGCGARVYARDIPSVGGVPQEKFPCKCGAALIAYQNLGNFGASA